MHRLMGADTINAFRVIQNFLHKIKDYKRYYR